MSDIAKLESELTAAIGAAKDEAALEAVRVAALGKSGTVSALLKTLGAMTPDERKAKGPAINGLKDTVTAAIAARKDARGLSNVEAFTCTSLQASADTPLPIQADGDIVGTLPMSLTVRETPLAFC